MAEELKVNPDQLAEAGRSTEEVANRMKTTMARLRDTLAGLESDSANQPWGNDKQGKKFADGDKGYKKARTNLLDGGDAFTKTLFDFGHGQQEAATRLREQEHSNTEQFGGGRA
ncbi:hypothetical protein BJY24_006315 [Nocardia transvalensis]|uniref:WXG100 family type VII secretion target n=1 Tax=Nocardia transvalensis TaxID=37333 RepID=A0A7W9ULC1_9NOCA|nr:hypothetical protein [Nocardia transvalensis]MBB5917403.1 hypothetical protein [Nocardia transvalensis]